MIVLDESALGEYAQYLKEKNMSAPSIESYMRTLRNLAEFTGGRMEDRSRALEFKRLLMEKGYAANSVNSAVSAINSFLRWKGYKQWTIPLLKKPTESACHTDKKISKEEYTRLVKAAQEQGNERLALLIQTLCALGIHISELPAVTAEGLKHGRITTHFRGRACTVQVPEKLLEKLRAYCAENGIQSGPVFITRGGKPLNRSNISRMMKNLTRDAQVSDDKIFANNLRQLFAQTYYEHFNDIAQLEELVGSGSVIVKRVKKEFTKKEQLQQMGELELVI